MIPLGIAGGYHNTLRYFKQTLTTVFTVRFITSLGSKNNDTANYSEQSLPDWLVCCITFSLFGPCCP